MAAHETFIRNNEIQGSSDRTFGLVIAGAFVVMGFSPLRHHEPMRYWAFGAALPFLALAIAAPKMLSPLNLLWTKFGFVLQKITNPLVMGVLFYFLITPVALIFKLFGKDPLNRRFDPENPDVQSYWVTRDVTDSFSETMKHQF